MYMGGRESTVEKKRGGGCERLKNARDHCEGQVQGSHLDQSCNDSIGGEPGKKRGNGGVQKCPKRGGEIEWE